MTSIAAADINVAEIMSHEENRSAADQLKAALTANPAVNQMMEAAQNVEEMYEAVKEYVSLKLEDFKLAMDKTIEYFKGPKVQLEDDMMECVVGGWSLSEFWNKHKKAICAVAVVAGMAILGVGAGVVVGIAAACVAGAAGVGIGAAVGGTVGGVVGALGGGAFEKHLESNQK